MLETCQKGNDLILLRPETKVKLNEINKLIGKKIKKNLNKFDEIKLSSVIK